MYQASLTERLCRTLSYALPFLAVAIDLYVWILGQDLTERNKHSFFPRYNVNQLWSFAVDVSVLFLLTALFSAVAAAVLRSLREIANRQR